MQYCELFSLLQNRRSCRKFQNRAIPEYDIHRVIEAGRWCPSSHNDQNTITIRVKDADMKEKLRKSTSLIMTNHEDFDPFYGAPEILVVMRNADTDKSLGIMDGTLVMSNMILAAETLDLGTCWINTAQYNHTFIWSVMPELLNRAGIKCEDKLPYIGVGYLAIGYRNCRIEPPLPRKENRIYEI